MSQQVHHVVQTKRRSWNLDEFREKAQRRQEEQTGGGKRVPVPPEKREHLQAREQKLDLEKAVGTVKVC
jgi:hypothetical protein